MRNVTRICSELIPVCDACVFVCEYRTNVRSHRCHGSRSCDVCVSSKTCEHKIHRTNNQEPALMYLVGTRVMHVRLIRKNNGRKSLEFATELMTC
jgi:hypothetical protein